MVHGRAWCACLSTWAQLMPELLVRACALLRASLSESLGELVAQKGQQSGQGPAPGLMAALLSSASQSNNEGLRAEWALRACVRVLARMPRVHGFARGYYHPGRLPSPALSKG